MGHTGPVLSAVTPHAVPGVWRTGAHSRVRGADILPWTSELCPASRYLDGAEQAPARTHCAGYAPRQRAIHHVYHQAGPRHRLQEVS